MREASEERVGLNSYDVFVLQVAWLVDWLSHRGFVVAGAGLVQAQAASRRRLRNWTATCRRCTTKGERSGRE